MSSIPTLQSTSDYSHATFVYTGTLNFLDEAAQNSSNSGDLNSNFFGVNAGNITGYSGQGPTSVAYGDNGANFNTLGGYLATSGSVNGYGYGSLYTFTAEPGNYGAQTITLTHDDGASVYANGQMLSGTTAGPTGRITESVSLPMTSSYTIAYARENGTPSVLQVTGGQVSAVPEPSTWLLMFAGIGGIGLAFRQSKRKHDVRFRNALAT